VAALIGDGLPHVYEIRRDREAEESMLARVEEFWRRFILGDEVPPIGASAAAGQWLQHAYPRPKADLRPATDEELLLLGKYTAVRITERAAKEARTLLENQIKLAIGDREGLYWPDGKFTWRNTKDRLVTNWQAMAKGLAQRFLKDDEERATLTGIHTNPVRGTRRIYFKSRQFVDTDPE
jgi:predicted phage-related endonuclease